MQKKIPHASHVAAGLSRFITVMKKVDSEYNNFQSILDRFDNIDDVIYEMRDKIENFLLNKSVLSEVRTLSSSAKGDTEMLLTELKAVNSTLNQNRGNSVDALVNSTQNLMKNIDLLHDQIERTSS
ncbi:hypothetical protein [Mammaliicoccus sp. Dog046]|uniref:hypothetical protein n=1 Tax=Mammaliicoccus sp. Dog046 TaxID=3034233 RepID=UPI002B2570F9|nr:hypothetical protein [Mammaliicoccus sp. Dog046]WQK86345.1 hypothetical protein P3U32_04865 [Mammaliicoccus sp. Dog046]